MFHFGPLPDAQFVLAVTVPKGIESESELFNALYERLRFPDYFGDNWNALEECLRDLAWLPNGRIAISHEDLPLRARPAALGIYLSILDGAVRKAAMTPGRGLAVAFPESSELEVRRTLAGS